MPQKRQLRNGLILRLIEKKISDGFHYLFLFFDQLVLPKRLKAQKKPLLWKHHLSHYNE